VYESSLAKIWANGSEVSQVWTNYLIDNALDAMNDNGILELVIKNYGERIEVHITDSASGIPPEIQARIFEPFFATKLFCKGSGLGLEVIGRLVENRHQGSISVESYPGKTQFMISLPVHQSQA
jgi:signal transduction histidine kinase